MRTRHGMCLTAARPLRRAVVFLAVMAVVGCGDSEQDIATEATEATPQEQAVPSTDPTTTVSPLKRRDAPPQGVQRQFSVFVGGDPPCPGHEETSAPKAMADAYPRPEVGSFFYLCFNGLKYGQPTQVEVALPNGIIRKSDERYAFKEWYVMPGDPLGMYRVTARQGDKIASGSFLVGPASTPRILLVRPELGPPGSTFSFLLAGFPPRALVPVDVCVATERKDACSYLTTLHLQMDDQGSLIYRLATDANDPPGSYCLVPRQLANQPQRDDCDVGGNMFSLVPR